MRHRIAHLFGRHSKKVWRAIVGASLLLALRPVVFAGQLTAALAALQAQDSMPLAVAIGTLIGWLARIVDNMIGEFVFPHVRNYFLRGSDQ